jgi:hypothetical protein
MTRNPYNLNDHWKPGQAFIYALCEPDSDEVRYIGKAECNVLNRWTTHLSAARRGASTPVARWMASLLAEGKEPRPIMLAECPIKMVKDVERAWVHLFEDNGYKLLNVALVKKCLVNGGKRGRQPAAALRYLNGSDQDGAQ